MRAPLVWIAVAGLLQACQSAPPPRASDPLDSARALYAQSLASADTVEAAARAEAADALLVRACPSCARERIPVLVQLSLLYASRGDAESLARCVARAHEVGRSLDATRLSDWPLLRELGALYERAGDYAGALQVERDILAAKLQILDEPHPQIAASRARIAELSRLGGTPPVGAAPPDPAR